jgi:hypothetical protein
MQVKDNFGLWIELSNDGNVLRTVLYMNYIVLLPGEVQGDLPAECWK